MANVFDVACYIVDKLNKIDTWKLQKLVYYCQAWSYVWDNKALFNSRIQAWANGPVCPDLYEKHKGQYSVDKNFFADYNYDPSVFTEDEIESMNSVIDHYGNKKGHWLRELTHQEDPWLNARKGIPDGENSNHEITLDAMRAYYGSL